VSATDQQKHEHKPSSVLSLKLATYEEKTRLKQTRGKIRKMGWKDLSAFSPTASSGSLAYIKWNSTARIYKLPRQTTSRYYET